MVTLFFCTKLNFVLELAARPRGAVCQRQTGGHVYGSSGMPELESRFPLQRRDYFRVVSFSFYWHLAFRLELAARPRGAVCRWQTGGTYMAAQACLSSSLVFRSKEASQKCVCEGHSRAERQGSAPFIIMVILLLCIAMG